MRFRAKDLAGNIGLLQEVEFDVTAAPSKTCTRVAGADRYLTAIEASRRAYPGGSAAVVIATGENWPDALGGSALAGAVRGPLLLTRTAALPDQVAAEVRRLEATKAYILGGTGAVSPNVEGLLRAILGQDNVTRLAGEDRYATARVVADATIESLGDDFDGTALVATGGLFPDALAGSPLATSLGWPILLAAPSAARAAASPYVPEEVTQTAILGGTGAVGDDVEATLVDRLGEAGVRRIAGVDRYGTARAVAEEGVAAGMHWDGVGVATGEDFPDALSGGAMLGRMDAVMLLTRTSSLSDDARDALVSNAELIDETYIIGGTGAVGSACEDAVRAAIGQ